MSPVTCGVWDCPSSSSMALSLFVRRLLCIASLHLEARRDWSGEHGSRHNGPAWLHNIERSQWCRRNPAKPGCVSFSGVCSQSATVFLPTNTTSGMAAGMVLALSAIQVITMTTHCLTAEIESSVSRWMSSWTRVPCSLTMMSAASPVSIAGPNSEV